MPLVNTFNRSAQSELPSVRARAPFSKIASIIPIPIVPFPRPMFCAAAFKLVCCSLLVAALLAESGSEVDGTANVVEVVAGAETPMVGGAGELVDEEGTTVDPPDTLRELPGDGGARRLRGL